MGLTHQTIVDQEDAATLSSEAKRWLAAHILRRYDSTSPQSEGLDLSLK